MSDSFIQCQCAKINGTINGVCSDTSVSGKLFARLGYLRLTAHWTDLHPVAEFWFIWSDKLGLPEYPPVYIPLEPQNMHIAIDDTYGPSANANSSFVTGDRRTHVAVIFPDEEVKDIRKRIAGWLDEIHKLTDVEAKEFHFVDIYNRKPPWNKLPNNANLKVFEFFASIYKHYRWSVIIKTIDDRTLRDHGFESLGAKIDGLDISKREDLSLFWLLLKIKNQLKASSVPITLFLDEGREKPKTNFGSKIFHDWPASFQGSYASSTSEPLLQIADFIAFCINRSTHLATKIKRSDVDAWFLNLVGEMKIDCDDLKVHKLAKNFSVGDFDELHRQDRARKGLLEP